MNGGARKLTAYFGERTRVDGRFLSDLLLEEFAAAGVSSSVLFRAASGFGLRHRMRTDTLLTMSEDPSVLSVAVDEAPVIDRLRERVADLQPRGLLVEESVRLLDGPVSGVPAQARLVCHLGRGCRVGRLPAYVAVCALLQRHGVAGATVLTGVDGTAAGLRHRARFWSGNVDVPARVVALGDGAVLAAALPQLRELLSGSGHVLLGSEEVVVCRRDGLELARPPAAKDAEPSEGRWQRLTVITSESRLHDGEPVHRALVRRLRSGRARGVTVQRGVWGYHGDHPPHGDRLWQWGRRVPVVTTTVDTTDRVAEAYAVAEELTGEHGLVVVESVPWVRHLG